MLITGSTDGIGKASALKFVKEGYNVIIHGRNQEKALNTLDWIKKEVKESNVFPIYGDLRSHSEILMMVDEIYNNFDKIDILINNAGVLRPNRSLTEEEIEETFAVNYIAPFIISNFLLELLYKAKGGKIINVASQVHANHLDLQNLQLTNEYTSVKAYALSKTCLIMFTYQLAKKLEGTGITVNCLHPGIINTKLLHSSMKSIGQPPSMAADRIFYAATSPKLIHLSGNYFENNKITRSKEITYDQKLQEKLWKKTEEIIGFRCKIPTTCNSS